MSYTPTNVAMYCAVYAGALSGMGASGRILTSQSPAAYIDPALLAGAFAQAFDTTWGATATTALDLEMAEDATYAVWSDRAPNANGEQALPSQHLPECRAIMACMIAADAYVTGQGITPPPVPGGGGAVIFDGGTPKNMRGDRPAGQSPIDNTKDGIVNLASGGSVGVTASFATAGGGFNPAVIADYGTVAGGDTNTVSGDHGSIGGGQGNLVNGLHGTIAGGHNCTAGGSNGSIGGGVDNATNGNSATCSGGASNSAVVDFGTVGGGANNACQTGGDYGTIGGGQGHTITADHGTIAGGNTNTVNGTHGSVAGGQNNFATGNFSQVGGDTCSAVGVASVAQGSHTNAQGSYSRAVGVKSLALYPGQDALAGADDQVAVGDDQISRLPIYGVTPGAGAGESVVLMPGQLAGGVPITLLDGKAYTFEATVIAKGSIGGVRTYRSIKALACVSVFAGTITIEGQGVLANMGTVGGTDWSLLFSASGLDVRVSFLTGVTQAATHVQGELRFAEVV